MITIDWVYTNYLKAKLAKLLYFPQIYKHKLIYKNQYVIYWLWFVLII